MATKKATPETTKTRTKTTARKARVATAKAPAVKKGQVWRELTAGGSAAREGRVTGFDSTKVHRLAILEPVLAMTRTSRIAVTTLQKEWTLLLDAPEPCRPHGDA